MRSALGTVHGDAGREQVAPCGCGDYLRFDTDHFGRLISSCPTCAQRGRREAAEARRRAALEERQRIAAALEADRLERERGAAGERRRRSHRTRHADRKQGIAATDRVCVCRCGARIPYLGNGKPPTRCAACLPPSLRRARELRWQRYTQETT